MNKINLKTGCSFVRELKVIFMNELQRVSGRGMYPTFRYVTYDLLTTHNRVSPLKVLFVFKFTSLMFLHIHMSYK